MELEHVFINSKTKGENQMTENEIELIDIIRENDNQEQAMVTAVEVILSYLEQLVSSEEQVAVGLRVQV